MLLQFEQQHLGKVQAVCLRFVMFFDRSICRLCRRKILQRCCSSSLLILFGFQNFPSNWSNLLWHYSRTNWNSWSFNHWPISLDSTLKSLRKPSGQPNQWTSQSVSHGHKESIRQQNQSFGNDALRYIVLNVSGTNLLKIMSTRQFRSFKNFDFIYVSKLERKLTHCGFQTSSIRCLFYYFPPVFKIWKENHPLKKSNLTFFTRLANW